MKKVLRYAVSVALVGLCSCASSGPVPVGPDTYMIAKPGDFFTLSGASVQADLYREAGAFCVQQQKELMPVDSSYRDSGPARFATAEIRFRCLAKGDPMLGRPVPAPDATIKIVQ
jgi:hypothetical protein